MGLWKTSYDILAKTNNQLFIYINNYNEVKIQVSWYMIKIKNN